MRIIDICRTIEKNLKIPVNPSQLRFYDRIKLIPVERKENRYREYTAKDVAKITKAVLLTRLNFGLPLINELLTLKNKKVRDEVLHELKLRKKWISLIEEII